LEHHVAPVVSACRMHLADGRRRQGRQVEAGEARPPGTAELGFQHRRELRRRHAVRRRAEELQGGRELLRQHAVASERQHLPHLHGRAAQTREPSREDARVVGREQRMRELLARALRQALHLLGRSPERHLRRRRAQLQKAAQAAARNSGGGSIGQSALAFKSPLVFDSRASFFSKSGTTRATRRSTSSRTSDQSDASSVYSAKRPSGTWKPPMSARPPPYGRPALSLPNAFCMKSAWSTL